MKNLTKLFLVVILVSFAASTAAQEAKWFEKMSLNTFVSGGFTYNFNKPVSEVNNFRVFDFHDNQLKLDVIELSLKKDPEGKNSAGFRVDITGGTSIPKLTRSAGMNSGDIDVQQAYLSYIFPIGEGLKLDFGKFTTPFGYELIEGYDGYNDNYSRSFQFGYAIPFAHTGLRAGYSFSPNFGMNLIIVNGWDNAVDNNKSKTLGLQFFVSPAKDLNIYAGAAFGPEKDDNNSDNRAIVDLVASYLLTENLSAAVNFVYGMEQKALAVDVDAKWTTFSGYLKYAFTSCFSLSVRGEVFDDTKGFRTGIVQKLKEFTLTPAFKLSDNFIVRADLRYDMSDVKVFTDKDNLLKDNQFTIGLNFVSMF